MTRNMNLAAIAEKIGPELARGADTRDQTGAFIADNYKLLKQHKLFSAQVPEELGGGGVSHSEMAAFLRALPRYCASTALALSMHQHLVSAAIYNHRAGRPGKALLEKVVANELVLVSTGANDWLESSGTVKKADGGYLVTTRKPFASGAPMGDVLVTSAPYNDPKEGWQVLHFPVPFKAEGVSLADDWDTLGMRATGSHSVILDKVFVAEEAIALRRPRGEYHMVWNVVLMAAMPLIMSVYTGLAEAAVEIALAQAAKRKDDPAAPFLIGEMSNLLATAQLAADDMVRRANDLDFEATAENANAILIRKTIAAKAVIATVDKALETAGGAGFYRRLGLERLVRDARAAHFHPLQEKRQQHFTGRLAMGLEPVETEILIAARAA